ncbi:Uncharacterised protein [uncultured archaeon]|nr:Uncharacterised protein [uncultured archaeon]
MARAGNMAKFPLGQTAREVSAFLGEPEWLLRARLDAVALLEKRNGSAEISGFRMAKGKMTVKHKLDGDAVLLTVPEALKRGNALREQMGRPLTGKEPDSYLLSLALFTDARVVAVPAGRPADISLEICGKPPEYFAFFFLFADNAEASVIAKTSFANNAEECRALVLGKGASVQFFSLQGNGKKSDSSLGLCARQAEESSLKFLNANFGGSETKDGFAFLQEGRGSRCEHYEVSLAQGKQRYLKESNHFHLAPKTYSRSFFKYATADESQVRVDGKVTIAHGAPGSDTHLLSKSLLLSGKSVSHVVPQLFVHNDDVIAGHGSAMAPLDGEELFYLRSRGIDEQESKRLVLQGFLRELPSKAEMGAGISRALSEEIEKETAAVSLSD